MFGGVFINCSLGFLGIIGIKLYIKLLLCFFYCIFFWICNVSNIPAVLKPLIYWHWSSRTAMNILHISATWHTLAQKCAMKKKLFSLWKHKMTLLINLHSWNFCYFSCLAKYLLHTIFLIHNEMLKCNERDIQCTSFCKKRKSWTFFRFFADKWHNETNSLT